MIGQLEGLPSTHQKMSGISATGFGEVGAVVQDFGLGQDEILVEGELKFVNVIQIWKEFAFG